jgi:hypothetical protein
LLFVEDADAVRWSEKTVPHGHIRKVFETLLLAQPMLETMLKYMSSYLEGRTERLERPVHKLIYHRLQKFLEEVEKGNAAIGRNDLGQFGYVGLEE